MIASGLWLSVVLGLGIVDPQEPAADSLARHEFTETHMGSEFKIVLYTANAATARRASRAAYDRIAALDASFSDYQPDSELMRLCDRAGGPPVPVSADLFDILQRSQSMFERSDGAFDVTIGPLVRLWRRARRDRKLPSAENLERARALVSSRYMTLDAEHRTVALSKRGMKLDLGGIAKGYASQAAIDLLRREGVTRALVAGAGDIVVGDPPPDRDGWTIAVAPLNPSREEPSLYLALHNCAISTSGDAERYVEIDGKRYSHIVDPRTGLGVVDRCGVTVIAPNGGLADAIDTAVYLLGPTRGLPLIESTEGVAAYILRSTPEGVVTLTSKRFSSLKQVAPDTPPPSPANPTHRPTPPQVPPRPY